MADHYYTKQPNTAHHVNEWTFELKNHTFRFLTDSGVFSKGTVTDNPCNHNAVSSAYTPFGLRN